MKKDFLLSQIVRFYDLPGRITGIDDFGDAGIPGHPERQAHTLRETQ